MIEFFTALMSGHWLALFASWIWNDVLVAGTTGSWSIYTSAFGHAGLLWWFWALFLLIVAIIFIAYVWAAGIILYLFWFGAWFCWLIIWAYYLIFKILAWIWPSILLFLKAFALPVFAAFTLAGILTSDNWRWRTIFPFVYCGYFLTLFILCPLSWAIWFSTWTWVYFVIALASKDRL